jgi:hypothetical protein
VEDNIKMKGDIELIVDYKDASQEIICFPNTILNNGRQAIAASLGNEFGNSYNFFITRMLFGDGGTSGDGQPKFVDSSRSGLFGTTQVNKPITSTIDPINATQVVFTSVVSYSEGNGFVLNEMALQMNTGDLYSMATFGGITKTSQIQLTWNWRLSII